MAKRKDRRAASRRLPGQGRTTPKGTPPRDRIPTGSSSRYTPPVPREVKVSPLWVPVLMFSLLGLGCLIIVLNYLALLPTPGPLPGSPNNIYLLVGLGFITGGFITATQYH